MLITVTGGFCTGICVYIMQIDSFLCLPPWEATNIAICLYKIRSLNRYIGNPLVWSRWMFASGSPLAGVYYLQSHPWLNLDHVTA
jgi:hypothetical protein